MRTLALLAALSLQDIAGFVPAPVAAAAVGFKVGARASGYGVVLERDVGFTTRDGVRLSADIFHPKGVARGPTIMVRAPLSAGVHLHEQFVRLLGHYWASRGYNVVIQGTRGRFRSGGVYYPLVSDRADGLETLDWLAKQPWHDGRLGLFGGSAFGYSQWAIADIPPPRGPTAILPQIASTDHHAFFHPGGALSLQTALYWGLTSRGAIDTFPTMDEMAPGFAGWPAVDADLRARAPVAWFQDWVRHDAFDAYWKQIDGDRRPERLAAPALLMAGWYDPYLPGQVRDFERLVRGAKAGVADASCLIIGPWTHARQVELPGGIDPGDYRFESMGPSLPWFDRWLPPAGVKVPAPLARVRLYVMGANYWRDEAEWPLARAKALTYFLHSNGHANTRLGDGILAEAAPLRAEPPDRYAYDPANPVPTAGSAMLGAGSGVGRQDNLELRHDVLVYDTPAFVQDTEVTGPVRFEGWASSTAPATDFTAKLVVVHADGRAYNLSDGITRVTAAGPKAFPVAIALWPTSNVFKAGHRLRLEVSSSNYPRYDRHPNRRGVAALATTAVVATQTLFHDAGHPAKLHLQVVPQVAVQK